MTHKKKLIEVALPLEAINVASVVFYSAWNLIVGIWEQLNNPGFNPIEFDGIKKQPGLNSFILTAKQWVEKTGAIGLISRADR